MEPIGSIVRKFLDCTWCLEALHPPIYMCTIGHSFCERCKQKHDVCPIFHCPRGEARNYSMENIYSNLEVACKNLLFGCPEWILGANMKDHEKVCTFIGHPCPMKGTGCQWRGSPEQVFYHLRTLHASISTELNLAHLEFSSGDAFSQFSLMFNCYDSLFHFNCQLNRAAGFVQWVVYYLGPLDREPNFCYILKFGVEGRGNAIEYRCPIVVYREGEVPFSEDSTFIRFPILCLREYCDENDAMMYGFKIVSRDEL